MRRFLLVFPAFLAVLYFSVPLPRPLFPADYSTVVLDEEGGVLRAFLNGNEQWCFPPRQDLDIPQKLKTAVLLFEDRSFYSHPGVRPLSLLRALYQNASKGQVVSGASTITMQVSRLMRPKARTYLNKALEILQALKIELHYTKEETLGAYLDHAPYGGNIVGYQAASLRYFCKAPGQLTWGEAATLAVLPNAPGLVSPVADPDRLRARRNRLLARLRDEGEIDAETHRLARQEEVPRGARPFRMVAPHLARRLKAREGDGTIRTTILRAVQERAEGLVARHVAYLNRLGIRNGAVLVAETQSGKVRAYVGSQDFSDADAQGQVDGVMAARSSGSLLKPFLYALCMDEGIVLPQTLVRDVPSYYGAFSPSNADGKFSGLVQAQEGLIRSLNVPAVRLLKTYGVYPFYCFLEAAGISTLFRPADGYGLPLVIGGAEVTPWDMAVLFRGLGNGGRFRPLQVLAGPSGRRDVGGMPLISPGACDLTLNVLRDLKRPGAEHYWQQYQNPWPLAWKTGTSYGQRDAWAVGVSPQWTVAVWVGNFDGQGNANLTGSGCAGPLLYDVFNALPKDAWLSWFERPDACLAPVEICLDTGFRAGPACGRRSVADAPLHMTPLPVCPYHRNVFVTLDGVHQVCSLCWQPGGYVRVSRLVYPADVTQYLRRRGQMIGAAPSHSPGCPAQQGGQMVQILYPQENAHLWMPRDFDGSRQQVALRAAHREHRRVLFWYLDHRFIGSSQGRHVKAAGVGGGWHVVEVVDEAGNRDRRRFHVGGRKG